ncbi:hypothetical protein MLD38_037748 [Melastoma candidum]|uniref:Uncharacterized protein n=1 Tax=Melastoma candidum TaxID=119954 RepID=A0ACB9LQC2_9MYRT|nr:hypothetical protein MLD38_037748 [Melastoma candidum]
MSRLRLLKFGRRKAIWGKEESPIRKTPAWIRGSFSIRRPTERRSVMGEFVAAGSRRRRPQKGSPQPPPSSPGQAGDGLPSGACWGRRSGTEQARESKEGLPGPPRCSS